VWRGSARRTSQFPANVRVAKGRDWARRLGPALALACLAVGLSVQVALADTAGVTVAPNNGYPTTAITVDGTYFFTTGCPIGPAPITMTFYFYFDTRSTVIAIRVPVTICNKGLYDTGPLKPWTPPAALATVNKHLILVDVINSATGLMTSNSTTYVITALPTTPPPTTPPPTTPPPTTPPPTTPPPTTPPPTTPPPTTPPPITPPPTTPPPTTPPPTHRSSPIPTPVQHVAPSPTPATGCVAGIVSATCTSPSPTPCKQTAAVAPSPGPGGTGGGLMLALALFGSLPITAVFLNSRYLIRRRELARLACLLGAAALLVAGTSCARPIAGIHTLATPTPAASGPIVPTPTC
jgi:hypothetical protein